MTDEPSELPKPMTNYMINLNGNGSGAAVARTRSRRDRERGERPDDLLVNFTAEGFNRLIEARDAEKDAE